MVTIYLLWLTQGEPDQIFVEHQVCDIAGLKANSDNRTAFVR